jgi:hypothetical protein
MEEENNEKKRRTKLDIALIVGLSLCVACNVIQIILRIIEMSR